ncbi:MAG: GTP-binding protein [Bacteroidetes bacterium]|nr:GTP-binding protein [Bacteroidota bacterium]
MMNKEKMNIVITGHVDHGKSTVIGRLLADTNSLPEGKLQQVKDMCSKNAKPFEYAFLLDALKDEQSQGITIDAARCFFKTKKRDYIILDAPGHIEFLKNMVTGAARAEAALLVIDAKEGIQENSKRHGYMISMLGVKQMVVLVNKIDLVNYAQSVYTEIEQEYRAFLKELKVEPICFIPISAFNGDNICEASPQTSWYSGPTVLEQMDAFKKESIKENLPLRFPIQDIYKFTEEGDDRRLIAGTIKTGEIKKNDTLIFYPSLKKSTVSSIEEFNTPERINAKVGESIGITLNEQIYIKPGELIAKEGDNQPYVSSSFRVNMFWLGKSPMVIGKTYKLKLNTARVSVKLLEVIRVLDASALTTVENKNEIAWHDVAVCVLETAKPIAFDLTNEIEDTSRFVIVDNYEIAGGGTILANLNNQTTSLEKHVQERDITWDKGAVSTSERSNLYKHKGKFIIFTGSDQANLQKSIAKNLERKLFENNYKAYYLGISNIKTGLDSDMLYDKDNTDEYLRRLGELSRILTDSGQIFITTLFDVDDYDIEKLKILNKPYEILVINIGKNNFTQFKVDLNISHNEVIKDAVNKIYKLLQDKDIFIEYYL